MYIFLVSIVVVSSSPDCLYDQEKQEILNSVIKPYSSCFDYCKVFYSISPQRAYYNTTTHMCEPLHICLGLLHYDYHTNACYEDESLSKQGDATLPTTLVKEQKIGEFMICVNGFEKGMATLSTCVCDLLWEDSGCVDMLGTPYKCDKVVTDAKQHFFDDIQYNDKGEIIMYGPYTPTQLQIVLQQLHQQEQQQTRERVRVQTDSIFYVIEQETTLQPLIRPHEYLWIIGLCVFLYIVSCITMYEYQSSRVVVDIHQYRELLHHVLADASLIRYA